MKTLLEHQLRILAFVRERESNGQGYLIAHDPGCGKTEPILHHLFQNKNTKTLIIGPACIRNQWNEDIDNYELNAEYLSFETASRLGRKAKKLLLKQWTRCIIDEAHKLGTGISKLSKFCMLLKTTHIGCMTGTPVIRSKKDMVILSKCLKYDSMEELVEVGMLYESKDDVLDLPTLTINIHNLTNSEFVKHHHNAMVSVDFTNTMRELIRKRMGCLHPKLIDANKKDIPVLTKIELLYRLVKSSYNNTIIFTNYLKENRFITTYLNNQNIAQKVFSITGNVPKQIREEIFEIAKAGKRNISNILYHLYYQNRSFLPPILLNIKQFLVCPIVLVMQQQIGGVGLNLQAFENIFFPNPSYSPSDDFQALCRAHRLGQNKPVTANFIYANKDVETFIDNRINKLRNKKLKTIQEVTKIDLFKEQNTKVINYI